MIDFYLLHPEKQFNGKYNSDGKQKYDITTNYKKLINTKDGIRRVFEYCEDVRPLLAAIRAQLIESQNELDITIETLNDGLWSWQKKDFVALLDTAGIKVVDKAKNDSDTTFSLAVSCSMDDYNAFLRNASLPPADIKLLLVTAEHPDYRITGGIGSYIKECENLYGKESGTLLIDLSANFNENSVVNNSWITPQHFLSPKRISDIIESNYDTYPDVIFESLLSIHCLYPNIKVVESQEMFLEAAIRAKKINQYPADVQLTTMCHGSSFHLSRAQNGVLDAENIHVSYKEKYTIEESDVVYFPTEFLRKSYEKYGVKKLDSPFRIIRRLPFDYKSIKKGEQLSGYNRLIYIGKTTSIKGFDLFLETLLDLYKDYREDIRSINEIIVIATSTRIVEPHIQDLYRRVESILPIMMTSLPRRELLDALADYARDSLALITYTGDNHPLTILELLAAGHDFIAADAGGLPELIPQGYKKQYLASPHSESFANKVAQSLRDQTHRSEFIREVSEKYHEQQEKINELYSVDKLLACRSLNKKHPGGQANLKTVLYIKKTDDNDDLSKTLVSLKNQTWLPDQIIQISDDSQIKKHNNKDLVMSLVAGDILEKNALKQMTAAFSSHENLGVCFGFEIVNKSAVSGSSKTSEFHPAPPQLGSVFLQEKHNRRFAGMFRGDLYKNTENMDLSDWQLSITAACKGYEVFIVPNLLMKLKYVPEQASESEANSQTDRYARSFVSLPLFDAQVLYSELKRLDDIYWGQQMLRHLGDNFIRRDHPSLSYNIPKIFVKISHIYNNHTPSWFRRALSIIAHPRRTASSVVRRLRS